MTVIRRLSPLSPPFSIQGCTGSALCVGSSEIVGLGPYYPERTPQVRATSLLQGAIANELADGYFLPKRQAKLITGNGNS